MSKTHIKRDDDVTLCGINLHFLHPDVVELPEEATCGNCRGALPYAPGYRSSDTDGTNTEPSSELVQGSTNPKDDDFEKLLKMPFLGCEIDEFATALKEYVTLAQTNTLNNLPRTVNEQGFSYVTESDIDEAIAALQRDSQPGGTDELHG